MFQSLFLWMTLVGKFHYVPIQPPDNVSILVLVDDARGRASSACFANGMSRFQSLFLWMTLVGAGDRRPARKHFEFQSLFLWMTLVGFTAFRPSSKRTRFQSLFLWMTLVGPMSAVTFGSIQCLGKITRVQMLVK